MADHRRERRLRVYFEPRDIYVGLYIGPDHLYFVVLTLVFRWRRKTT